MIIKKATYKDTHIIADLVAKLLQDFNSQNGRNFNVDFNHLEHVTEKLILRKNFAAFIAYGTNHKPIGLVTIAEAFAIYNSGDYGVITELYVDKNQRSRGIGQMLLKEVFKFAKTMDWKKIEVGAPKAEEWPRTIQFYKNNGFELKGPKLRIDL